MQSARVLADAHFNNYSHEFDCGTIIYSELSKKIQRILSLFFIKRERERERERERVGPADRYFAPAAA
eukprot:SAG31_NODE_1558_length_7885_cov_2.567300_1_plen_68_part_00